MLSKDFKIMVLVNTLITDNRRITIAVGQPLHTRKIVPFVWCNLLLTNKKGNLSKVDSQNADRFSEGAESDYYPGPKSCPTLVAYS